MTKKQQQATLDITNFTETERKELRASIFWDAWGEKSGFNKPYQTLKTCATAAFAMSLLGSMVGQTVAANIYDAPETDPAYEGSLNRGATLASGEKILLNLKADELLIADVDSNIFKPINNIHSTTVLNEVLSDLDAASILFERDNDNYNKHVSAMGYYDSVSLPHFDRDNERYRATSDFVSRDMQETRTEDWLKEEKKFWQAGLQAAEQNKLQSFSEKTTVATNESRIKHTTMVTAFLTVAGYSITWLGFRGIGGGISAAITANNLTRRREQKLSL